MLEQNVYNNKLILCNLNPPEAEEIPREDPISMAFLPFVGPTLNHIRRVLSKHNIKTTCLLPKNGSFLWPFKDNLGVETPAIYNILCECDKVYNGQTRHFIETRIMEYHWYFWLYHPEKSYMVEHIINIGHCI